MEFIGQLVSSADFWETVISGAIGAVVGGVIAALIARWTFASDRAARREERAHDEQARAEIERLAMLRANHDRHSARAEDLLDVFAELLDVVSTTVDMRLARGPAQKLHLRVEALAMDLSINERRDFSLWCMHIHEHFLAMVEWEGNHEGWRSKTDEFRGVIALATEQLIQWLRGEASTDEFRLYGEEARTRFLPPITGP